MAKTKSYYESRPLKLNSRGGYADPEEAAFWAKQAQGARRLTAARSAKLDKTERVVIGVGLAGVAGIILHGLFGSKGR
jgi:hypothetical protein